MTDTNRLSHSKWNCKYHIVFAPKYRRQVIYSKIKVDIGQILRKLCEIKKVEILEANACPDHIHMLVKIPPNLSVAQFMGYLKGKSSLMIFDYLHSSALPAQPSTSTSLCSTTFWIAERASPRYCLGSKWEGCSTKCLRIAAVQAILKSESMLILQTAILAA